MKVSYAMFDTAKYARAIANSICSRVALGPEKKEVVEYSLDILLSSTLNIVIALVITSLFGVTRLSVTILLSSAFMRYFSGGAHCTTSSHCIIAGSITVPLLSLLANKLSFYTLSTDKTLMLSIYFALFLFAFVSIYLWAPADTPNKPVSTKKEKHFLRRASFICVTILALICLRLIMLPYWAHRSPYVTAILLGITWQSFSLSPLGYKTIHCFDNLLRHVGIN